MIKPLHFIVFLFFSNLAISAAVGADAIIDEIYYLHGAEERWRIYANNSVEQQKDTLTYPDLYQAELNSWLTNELSWKNVEPMFREKLKLQYSSNELIEIAESLRETPSGYPADFSQKGYGPALFNIGVAVAQAVYPALIARLDELRQQYEPLNVEGNVPIPEAPGISRVRR